MNGSARHPLHNFIPGRVFRLAYPVMLGMMSQVLLNVVDAAMVGRLGAAELASVGLGSMAFLVVALTFESLGTGTQIIVSRRWGEKDRPAASGVLLNSLLLTIPLGLLLTSMGVLEALPFIHFLVRAPEVRAMTTGYIRIRFLCLFFFLVFTSFRGYFDGVGKTHIRMYYMIIIVSLNIVLNYLLIFGKLGFPRMEVKGAALASTLSVVIGSIYILICGLRDSTLREHPFFLRSHIHLQAIKNIVVFSLPKAGRMFCIFTSFLLFLKIIGMIGVPELAASNILLAILSFSFMPGMGIGIAGATLIGQSLGAKKYQAARHYGWASARFGALFMGLAGIGFIIFARPILSFFTPDQAVVSLGYAPLIILGAVQIFDAFGIVLASCLEGAGATYWVMKADIIIHWLILLPLAYLLAVVLHWDSIGAWTSIGVGMILYAVIMARKFRSNSWLHISA
ncbi:MAG: MATE family efflux transporter [Candidatus Auribacterota bacterium]|nr:MATE family efflux transporter [Candidatus Auribacterota bacterium]